MASEMSEEMKNGEKSSCELRNLLKKYLKSLPLSSVGMLREF